MSLIEVKIGQYTEIGGVMVMLAGHEDGVSYLLTPDIHGHCLDAEGRRVMREVRRKRRKWLAGKGEDTSNGGG